LTPPDHQTWYITGWHVSLLAAQLVLLLVALSGGALGGAFGGALGEACGGAIDYMS